MNELKEQVRELGNLECFLAGKEFDESILMTQEQRRKVFIVLDGNKK